MLGVDDLMLHFRPLSLHISLQQATDVVDGTYVLTVLLDDITHHCNAERIFYLHSQLLQLGFELNILLPEDIELGVCGRQRALQEK